MLHKDVTSIQLCRSALFSHVYYAINLVYAQKVFSLADLINEQVYSRSSMHPQVFCSVLTASVCTAGYDSSAVWVVFGSTLPYTEFCVNSASAAAFHLRSLAMIPSA